MCFSFGSSCRYGRAADRVLRALSVGLSGKDPKDSPSLPPPAPPSYMSVFIQEGVTNVSSSCCRIPIPPPPPPFQKEKRNKKENVTPPFELLFRVKHFLFSNSLFISKFDVYSACMKNSKCFHFFSPAPLMPRMIALSRTFPGFDPHCWHGKQHREGGWWVGILGVMVGVAATGISADTPVGTRLFSWLFWLSVMTIAASLATLLALDGPRWIDTKASLYSILCVYVFLLLSCVLWALFVFGNCLGNYIFNKHGFHGTESS